MGRFDLEPSDFLAHEHPEVFYLEREAFEPIIMLATDSQMSGYEWRIGLDEDQVEFRVSTDLSESIQSARNNSEHTLVLINSMSWPSSHSVRSPYI